MAIEYSQILRSTADLSLGSKISIWGAGETGREFYRLLRAERPDVKVVRFIDSYRSGSWNGVDIATPNALTADDDLIIASVFWNEIVEFADAPLRGNFRVLSNELIHRSSHLEQLGSFHFQAEEVDGLRSRLEAIKEHMRSEEDRRIIEATFDLRVAKGELEFLRLADRFARRNGRLFATASKYAANIDLSSVAYVVEGGVFDGQDTFELVNAIDAVGRLKRLYAFDPFLDVLRAGKFLPRIDGTRVEFHPAALWDHDGQISFGIDVENPANSAVSGVGLPAAEGNARVFPAVAIDTFLEQAGTGLDLLKLDVEGAEMKVLRGAKTSIAAHRPKLALSLYHRKEDLIAIPEYLLELHPDYELSVSLNGPTFIDMVLYAQ